MELPSRIVFVCSLCLRQYDLKEDLRGHMMFFHGCQPMPASVRKAEEQRKRSLQESRSASPATAPAELQPMPFKDFRIALRVNMRVP